MAFDITDFVKSVPNRDTSREQIEYIHISKLVPDPDNFYSMDGISELAANIETAGLQQPIRCYPCQDRPSAFYILSGHRRHAALQLLAEEDPGKWEQVPCIVERDEVPLEARKLRLLLANRDTRKLTSADLDRQAAELEKYIVSLKEQGYSFPGRLSDYVAQTLSTSKTKLNRLKIIREGLILEWRKLWEDGKVNDSVGYALAHLGMKTQESMFKVYRTIPHELTAQFVDAVPEHLDKLPKYCQVEPEHTCSNISAMRGKIMGSFRGGYFCEGCCLDCSSRDICVLCCKIVSCNSNQKTKAKTSTESRGGSAEDKLEDLAEKCRQQEKIRMENLNRLASRFVTEHLNQGRLEDFILDAVYRNDVVEAFKRTVCATHSGGSSPDGICYSFSPRGVHLGDEKGRVECTIVEFTDAVMVAALKLCIKNKTVPEDVSG